MIVETFEELLNDLRNGTPAVPEEPAEADMVPWRDRIDALDRAILQMLNERAVCANAIGFIKRKLGMPVYVPSREEEVLDNVTRSNRGPLANDAVQRLFERVIDETRSLERHLFEETKKEERPRST